MSQQNTNNNNNNNQNNNNCNENCENNQKSTNKRASTWDPLDLENYYDELAFSTFPTRFLRLSKETAQAIVDKYDDLKFNRTSNDPELKIDPQKLSLLKALATDIDNLRADMKTKNIFARLSTRSPKDVALNYLHEKTTHLYNKNLKELNNTQPNIPSQILEVISMIRATTNCLMSDSGQEVVDMLCRSERTYQDLFRRLLVSNDDEFDMMLVVREWIEIKPEYEFRGFCYNDILHGVTQYYKACFVPEISEKSAEFSRRIRDFFLQVRPKLQALNLHSYVIDFAVTPDKVYLVELNHWGTTASSSLFSWSEDWELLHHGPYEFRCLNRLPHDIGSQIAGPLRKMMNWPEISEKEKEKQKQKEKDLVHHLRPDVSGPKKNGGKVSKEIKAAAKKLSFSATLLPNLNLKKIFSITGLYQYETADSIFWQLSPQLVLALGGPQVKAAFGIKTDFATCLVGLIFLSVKNHHKEWFKQHKANEADWKTKWEKAERYLDCNADQPEELVHNAVQYLKKEFFF